MEDFYPSRISEKPQIKKRKDPVIHTDRKNDDEAPLTKDQLDFYEENGFLQIKNLFSDEEMATMQKGIFELQESKSGVQSEKVIREPNSNEIRSIFAVDQDSEYFKKIAADQRLLDIVNHLLGSDVYVHQSRINYKPGFSGKEFNWHSDFETWHTEDGMPRMRALSMSIALSDNYVHNGPLMLVPGSHKYYVSCVGATPEDNYKESLKAQKVGVPDNDSLTWLFDQGGNLSVATGKAGTITIFESNTMHASTSNMTPYPRNNLFMVYNSVENKLVEPFAGAGERPEYIAVRKTSEPLGKEKTHK
ncbi:ectoine hydroxylase [Halalkalibacter sp. APA_J-10(15)]|uniref:ectoine hydroxylase n=1 Tax=Halalkalibacter sp. APA_J-10(15) TaxID=2933805 RepID=UPI001FF49352|nr:ectoine hydroxylase [Halalkalibacter sp. APA_J-10(15)]MCK0472693.1 ectoine hydroxylase [Halalkalibacter sp. APA_J-10(15)]